MGLISGVTRTFGKYQFWSLSGAQWLRVFYHKPGGAMTCFASESEFLNVNEHNKFSILSEIDESYKINGKYEFLIYYPEINKYNWWRQSLLPMDDPENPKSYQAKGYENVTIMLNSTCWGGLVNSTIPYREASRVQSYLDGCVGDQHYWFAIGLRYPSQRVPSNEEQWVSDVSLWIRIVGVDHKMFITNNLIIKFNFILYLFSTITLLTK